MPVLTLHLLTLNKATDPQSFIHQLKQSTTKVVVASRPRHTVIHPSILDNSPLATTKWDLLLLLQSTSAPSEDPIPSELRQSIISEYKLTTGIPSKLITSYPARDAELKANASSIPLTGSLDKIINDGAKDTSQNLEVSPELLDFMTTVSKTHPGPVTMLNLLHFHHPNGKQNYYQYGQAFGPVAGKRGGSAKLVGNVVPPGQGRDSRGSSDRPANEWWNEISIVHYPSIRHFCDMLAGDDYQAINGKYRLSALRDTFLLCTTEFDVEEAGSVKL
ncbi:uncharacterized protein N7503_010282 [Penicillium pulvis]|uniref:uncharacterized protein n=1 Tax=Penicillium pulvis TaxID=1562058 RepID=UPI002548E0ED|nr:uncharacterized protein N7503_010282 [Penicillium pulvis]KAJ5785070.1 hypothetical protein N7503_010282 [Penicillium pulvis]